MNRQTRQLVFILIILIHFCKTEAQFYIGFTGDLGNKASSHPNPNSLFKKAVAPSGSVTFIKHEEIRNGWSLQYGGALGDLGYRIDAAEADTLTNDPDFYDHYPNYNTIYINGKFSFGRQFLVKRKNVSMFLGGGATYYLDTFGSRSRSSSSVWDGNSFEKVFEYEMVLTDNRVKGFAEFSIQTALSPRMLIGVLYRYHFSPALKGTYNFYHMKDAPSGDLSLAQRAFSILFLVRIGKKFL